jgi:hypothetical protein
MDIDRVGNRGASLYGTSCRRRDVVAMSELEALARKITEEDPGYWDRVADRIIAEAR